MPSGRCFFGGGVCEPRWPQCYGCDRLPDSKIPQPRRALIEEDCAKGLAARRILAYVSLAHRPADLTRNAIAAAVGISPSRVSHHLRTLTLAGELDCRLMHVAGYRRRVRVWHRQTLVDA